jgi:glycosyltransferase involved in cell wall biosynthesis
MNVLIINWQDWCNPFAGGAEVYLYEIFSRLIKKGHKITLLVSRAQGQSRYEIRDGFEIYRIGKRSNFNFVAPTALRALLRHKTFDIVIDDLNKIPFYSPAFTRKKVMPMLMHLFRKTIFSEANPLLASYVYLAEWIIPFFYQRSPFVAISHSTADDLRAIGISKNIHVVQCGTVSKTPFSVQREKDLVVYVGRVKKYKSIDHFVKAIHILQTRKTVRAMIIGDGDATGGLTELSKQLGTDIVFTGYVSEEEKYRIYSRARVVVQPSVKEGWGLTTVEAQSCGTPVVCADSPGLREAVVDKKTGFLYPYGDIDALVTMITRLLEDEVTWDKLSRAAVTWAKSFTWDSAAKKFEKVLNEELMYEEDKRKGRDS